MTIRGTTICAVRKNGMTAIAGDGQVTMGESVIMKNGAVKVRRVYNGQVVIGHGGLAQAERLRDGRAGDVGVQDGGFVVAALHQNGHQGSHHGLADAALAADNANDFLDVAELVRRRGKLILSRAGRAVRAAAATIVGAIFAH